MLLPDSWEVTSVPYEVTIGQYYNVDSVIHRIDPRIKLTLLLVFIVATFFVTTLPGLFVPLLFLLMVIALSKVPYSTVFKAIAPISFIFIFPLLFNFFFISSGNELLRWGPILITDEGLWRGFFMTLRLFLLFFCANVMMLTTSSIALCDAVGSMLKPFERFGVPSFEISMMLSIALRFIPTLLDDFERVRKAQLARGANLNSGGPITRIKAIVPLLVPMFAQSFRHAEDLAYAMESRCYHGGSNRTHYHVLKIEMRDYVAVVMMVLLLIIAVIWL